MIAPKIVKAIREAEINAIIKACENNSRNDEQLRDVLDWCKLHPNEFGKLLSFCIQQTTKKTNMTYDLIKLAKECPDITVSIKLNDLLEANNLLIAETKRELEQAITDQEAETYPSRDKVMEILGVSSSTLWRWHKIGYLVPLNVGGKRRRYRMSDVKRILEGK